MSIRDKNLNIGCMFIHDTAFLTLQDCAAMPIDTGTALAKFIGCLFRGNTEKVVYFWVSRNPYPWVLAGMGISIPALPVTIATRNSSIFLTVQLLFTRDTNPCVRHCNRGVGQYRKTQLLPVLRRQKDDS